MSWCVAQELTNVRLASPLYFSSACATSTREATTLAAHRPAPADAEARGAPQLRIAASFFLGEG
eukprot:2783677-Alexandrium_andersonii.AAC.1